MLLEVWVFKRIILLYDTRVDELIKRVIIRNELGLHARSAAKLAKIAQQAEAGVWVIKDDMEADATSVIDVLTLACPRGTPISIRVEDRKDIHVLDAIVALVEQGFEEQD